MEIKIDAKINMDAIIDMDTIINMDTIKTHAKRGIVHPNNASFYL